MNKLIALLLLITLTMVLILFNSSHKEIIVEKFQEDNTSLIKIGNYDGTLDNITKKTGQNCLGIECETYSFDKVYSSINIPNINSTNDLTFSVFFKSNE